MKDENRSVTYDENGFDENGFHKDTHTQYDLEGYMKDGFNRKGWNRKGVNKETRKLFDIHGFDESGTHEVTKKKQDEKGFIQSGFNRRTKSFYDEEGYDINGYDDLGFDKNGINKKTGTEYTKHGFDKDKHHKETGTLYDPEGYNAYGYDEEGYDRKGFDANGLDRDGYNASGYNEKGVDRDGLTPDAAARKVEDEENKKQKLRTGDFNRDGIHVGTGTKYNYQGFDNEGFKESGYNAQGFDKDGYDINGFNKEGINEETGTLYDPEGYDRDGVNEYGFDRQGEFSPKLRLAIEFMVYDNSIILFARTNGVNTSQVREALKYSESFPKVLEALDSTLSNSTVRNHYIRENKKTEILNNNITPSTLYSIEKTLKECSPEELEVAMENIYRYIIKNEIEIMDYKRMFDLELDKNFIENIKFSIKMLLRKRNNNTGNNQLHEVYKRIDMYKSPYRETAQDSIGYIDATGQTVMVEVTPELRETARKYLTLTDEYICQKTMKKTMMAIIKGNLTPDMIDSIEPKKHDEDTISKEETDMLVDDFIEDLKVNNNIKSEVGPTRK